MQALRHMEYQECEITKLFFLLGKLSFPIWRQHGQSGKCQDLFETPTGSHKVV